MKYLRKVWWDHFTSSRYCVSCGFCQNSFCHFYQPPCALEEKFLVEMGEESPGIRVKFWNSLLWEIMAKPMKMRGGRHTWGVRMSMLFVVLPRWQSPGFSCSVSFSQRFSGKRTGGTDFVWGCRQRRSTSAMWIFKSSYLISFWFAGIIWCTHIFH